ncbi:hypothetical protein ACFVZH_27685 [Streptomyces sp. NPDC059534]|uniref:hypothetical protein n=1 Tax=Streptomyces sp. NPDC059534 TaxID=3346859 RepID=UPI00367BAC66
MSGTPGSGRPDPTTTLFQHALRLHRLTPDTPLHRGGEPFPGVERRGRPRGEPEPDRALRGTDVARLLDHYFRAPDVSPGQLAARLRRLPPECRPDEHIAGAARRAPADRARRTGRWLVRHGTDIGSVAVGLALLAESGTMADIPRIQTVGLLSHWFGTLAAQALVRLPGGFEGLIWLGERVTGWGRVHVVETLCRHVDDHPVVRPWLMRKALDGDFLNSYFADRVAEVTGLHEIIAESGHDAALVDQAGRILHVMTYCEGMGESLRYYPHALAILEAHARHVGALGPSAERYFVAATVAAYLMKESPVRSDAPATRARWDAARRSYLALTDREDWCGAAREGLAAGDHRLTCLADSVAPELGLRAYRDDARRA